MVALSDVREHNKTLTTLLAPSPVAIFIGGTSGIGLSTAREFLRNTTTPHIYLVGRNESEAHSKIIPELKSLNASSQITFIKSDVSLLKNVDATCREIASHETKVNLLFMTPGYFTMDRNPAWTDEGLERKFALHYYARMRFITNLTPLLSAAANDADPKARLSRVISVLDARTAQKIDAINFDDLALKKSFSLKGCAFHACGMNSLALEHFATAHPNTSYIHMYPSVVHTNVMRGLGSGLKAILAVLAPLSKPFSVDITESGERHLFAATAPRFAPRAEAERTKAEGLERGRDGLPGGAFDLNWNDDVLGDSKKVDASRKHGAVEKVWKHTEEVFGKIDAEGRY